MLSISLGLIIKTSGECGTGFFTVRMPFMTSGSRRKGRGALFLGRQLWIKERKECVISCSVAFSVPGGKSIGCIPTKVVTWV